MLNHNELIEILNLMNEECTHDPLYQRLKPLIQTAMIDPSHAMLHEIEQILELNYPLIAQRSQMGTPIFPNSPLANELNGPIKLGHILREDINSDPSNPVFVKTTSPLGITNIAHTFVGGTTQFGKTNLLLMYLLYFALYGMSLFIFSYNKEYRKRSLFHAIKKLLIFRWNDFKFNPLFPPPGVDPISYYTTYFELLGQAMGLLEASSSLLLSISLELLKKHQSQGTYPTLFDVYDALNNMKCRSYGKMSTYRETCLNRLKALLLSCNSIYDCEQGYPLDKLLFNQNVSIVLEIDGLYGSAETLLINSILNWLFLYKLNN